MALRYLQTLPIEQHAITIRQKLQVAGEQLAIWIENLSFYKTYFSRHPIGCTCGNCTFCRCMVMILLSISFALYVLIPLIRRTFRRLTGGSRRGEPLVAPQAGDAVENHEPNAVISSSSSTLAEEMVSNANRSNITNKQASNVEIDAVNPSRNQNNNNQEIEQPQATIDFQRNDQAAENAPQFSISSVHATATDLTVTLLKTFVTEQKRVSLDSLETPPNSLNIPSPSLDAQVADANNAARDINDNNLIQNLTKTNDQGLQENTPSTYPLRVVPSEEGDVVVGQKKNESQIETQHTPTIVKS